MPIFDYHNHLSPKEIFERAEYGNITRLWLDGDHYKWRAMRVSGVDESYITGDAPDYDKFIRWAETVERIPGNPLYHWTHMELQRYFGVYSPLNVNNAPAIWQTCNEQLRRPGYDAVSLLERVKVKGLCTTDAPSDTLEWHAKIRGDDSIPFKVLPTFRPDRVLHIDDVDVFAEEIKTLGKRFNIAIDGIDGVKKALTASIAFFKANGCVLSDHGFIDFVYAANAENAEKAFDKALSGETPDSYEIAAYKGEILRFLGAEYVKNGIAMQLHLGALRDNNTVMLNKLGANTGFDSVGAPTSPRALSSFLDDLNKVKSLPKTILYCLNPSDNAVLSTMAVNFAAAGVFGKVQFGSAWWFLDNIRGISAQIDELLETGLMAASIGMLTDSRSFTSFSRHEYFRRILCDKLGRIIEDGEYPPDFETMGRMVQNVCYNNAVEYFGVKL
jgi:glucuronate isomerase